MATHPCNCGFRGDPAGQCQCTAEQIQRYKNRISGPILDRIDMHIEVPRIPIKQINQDTVEETSATVRERVIEARNRQLERAGKPNTKLTNDEIKQHCRLSTKDQRFLEQAAEKLRLSARGYYRVLKVARSIADLEGSPKIIQPHLLEALSYRPK